MKKGCIDAASFFSLIALLCRMYCLNRTNVCTGTAFSADICIDLIDVALRYCLYRTFINTGSACSAIFIDFVSHDTYF